MPPKRSIVFTHVPRTAGSSIHYAFLRASAEKRAHVYATGFLLKPNKDSIDRAFAEGQLYLGGHFSLEEVETATAVNCDETINFLTLRDPLERFLSHHALIQSDERATNIPSLRNTTISAFLAELKRFEQMRMIDNPHCVTICGEPSFEAAKAAIAERYDFACVTARVADVVEQVTDLAARPEWPGGRPALPDFPHNSVSHELRAVPSEAERAQLEPFLAEDRKLLDWVQQAGGLVPTRRRARRAV
ncbi:sulfotransferase family 2 domain-containing protein [Pseudohoeflea coraliihabitans]|uniref:Sulfotransferase family protein n=1 Tax=Pseudohoeflea coraliihabitans TaxID=2860393 RepID=A0ABS6WQB9_9HYPH|nr:sulfotransferase family 2 domain-containing protein [Pseudohoeflea sp. DP4N28-3]MBW3097260.1 sulfotransferase family protein [Pseudohoeflea sp. DP4N28-3]